MRKQDVGKAFCLSNQMVTASNLGSVMSHVGSLDSGRENGRNDDSVV